MSLGCCGIWLRTRRIYRSFCSRAGAYANERGWRTRPFLPLPAKDYWAFRVTTALGFNDATMSVGDVIHAARWSRQQRVGR